MQKQLLRSSMTHGAFIGIALIAYSLLIYLLGIDLYSPAAEYKSLSYVIYIIINVGIFISIKVYRNSELDGYISYGKSLGYGTLTGLFASIIYTLYIIILFKFIDPSLLEFILDVTEQGLIDQGFSNTEITQSMPIARRIVFPAIVAGTIFGNTVVGFIFSLIASIFLRKEKNQFENRKY